MKHNNLYLGLMAAIAVSCSVEELEDPNAALAPVAETFYAYAEDRSPADADTRVYIDADDSHHIHWNKDDRITVFSRRTVGLEYAFQGEDGSTEGAFKKVSSESGSDHGEPLPAIYAIYPHSEETTVQSDGTISFNLPATQVFLKDDSFGKDANVMVAKTENDQLYFKNAVGYLTFRLYGNRNMSISSITLKGKNEEVLAGPGTIDMSGELPSLSMAVGDDAITEIKLFCQEVVALSTDSNDCREFWFALPPVTFSEGFTITIATSDGGVMEKSTSNQLVIERNKVKRMAPIQVSAKANTNLKINSLTKVYGKERKTTTSGHYPWQQTTTTIIDKTYSATKSSDGLTLTFTIPTYTDFRNFVMDFSISGGTGTVLKANDKVIESGVTPFDASQPVALAVCNGDSERRYTLIVRNTGLPVVRITTTGDGFTLDKVESYTNALQKGPDGKTGTDYRVWLPDKEDANQADWSASVRIENADGTPGMDGYEVGTQIKGRGNYTWIWEKKPYAFKFADSKEVLGMPAHKRWILLANWRDRTLLRNDASFWLSKHATKLDENGEPVLVLPYTTRGQFVELEFNGEHRGNYYLCEQIKINENRVNIAEIKSKNGALTSETGGFLMEIDSYFDEVNKFRSSLFGMKYMFKEPDEDTSEKREFAAAYSWMENYINNFEARVKTRSSVAHKDYEDYLDVDSAIMFMLLNELTGNRDFFQGNPHFGPHSTYLYKDKDSDTKSGKLFMGPIWDFDYETFISQENIEKYFPTGWRGFDNEGYYYHYLCYNEDFVQRIKDLWNANKGVFSGLTGYITDMQTKITLSQQFDQALWPNWNQTNRTDNYDSSLSFADAITRMKDCFTARVGWLDSMINDLEPTDPVFRYETPDQWPTEWPEWQDE